VVLRLGTCDVDAVSLVARDDVPVSAEKRADHVFVRVVDEDTVLAITSVVQVILRGAYEVVPNDVVSILRHLNSITVFEIDDHQPFDPTSSGGDLQTIPATIFFGRRLDCGSVQNDTGSILALKNSGDEFHGMSDGRQSLLCGATYVDLLHIQGK